MKVACCEMQPLTESHYPPGKSAHEGRSQISSPLLEIEQNRTNSSNIWTLFSDDIKGEWNRKGCMVHEYTQVAHIIWKRRNDNNGQTPWYKDNEKCEERTGGWYHVQRRTWAISLWRSKAWVIVLIVAAVVLDRHGHAIMHTTTMNEVGRVYIHRRSHNPPKEVAWTIRPQRRIRTDKKRGDMLSCTDLPNKPDKNIAGNDFRRDGSGDNGISVGVRGVETEDNDDGNRMYDGICSVSSNGRSHSVYIRGTWEPMSDRVDR